MRTSTIEKVNIDPPPPSTSTFSSTGAVGLGLFMFFFTAVRTLRVFGGFRGVKNVQRNMVVGGGAFNTPIPSIVHATLDTLHPKDRIIVIGDVHGCLDELQLLLQQCEWKQGIDTLVFVGDLVNKGPKSSQVVKFVRETNSLSVRGNHDDACIRRALDYKATGVEPIANYSYVKDFSDDDLAWLKELPYTLSIPSHQSIVVHAGLVPGVDFEDQNLTDMYTMRDIYPISDTSSTDCDNDTIIGNDTAVCRWKATPTDTVGVAWAPHWKDPDNNHHVFFGHDARRGLQLTTMATGLDTGCCYGTYGVYLFFSLFPCSPLAYPLSHTRVHAWSFHPFSGRKLTAMILPEKRLVDVAALKVYQEIKKND